ncbi:MAG: flagellar basal body rod protein FlgB [Corticimicrobacter sp.]|uniref:flagellar basal body rod protein FlgB n=1 Tax=Corticimicrobacter sp. TaxID=2678536 RepID=UPI0032DB710C
MPVLDRINEHFGFHQKAIGLRAERQEVLSSNIANADTPGYKARDFSFGDAMQQAMEGSRRLPDVSLALTSSRHIPAKAHSAGGPETLLYRQPLQPSLDGNTVDMDVERVQFADNTLRYQTGLTVMSGRIKSLQSALQSQ